MEKIESNGVTFTPEKVVNLDEIIAESKRNEEAPKPEDKPADKKAEEDPKPEDAPADPKPEDEPADKKADEDPKPDDTVDLDEISLKLGDEEMSANKFLDRYEEIKKELDEVKGDEFLSKFIKFYKSGGDPMEYLDKATKKWEGVDDVELLKMQFDSENADIDKEGREILFERRLRELYGVNADGSFDDEGSREAKLGKQLMKRDASKFRGSKIEEQKNFVSAPDQKKSQEAPKYDPVKAAKEYMEDAELQDFIKSKSVKIGEGFAYEVKEPSKVIGMMANVGDFWKLFAKQDGSMDKERIAKVFAYALDPKAYDSAIMNLGKDAGAESYVKEQKNIVNKKQNTPDRSTDTDTAVIRNGKIVNPSDREKFVKGSVMKGR